MEDPDQSYDLDQKTVCETCCTLVFNGKGVGHWMFEGVAQEHNNTGKSAERIYLTYSLRAAICVLYASVLGDSSSVEDCSNDPAGSSHLMWKLTAANLTASLLLSFQSSILKQCLIGFRITAHICTNIFWCLQRLTTAAMLAFHMQN